MVTVRNQIALLPALLLLLATALAVPACGDGGGSADEDMRAAVRADITQIMSDIGEASAQDPAIAASSNPYDYVGISPAFDRLVARGEPALDAIATVIEASADNGLREYLLAIAGERILRADEGATAWETGKEWAALFRSRQQGAATPTSPPASQADAHATAQAKVTLRALFAAWKAKDAEACATYLPANRQGPAWEFEGLDRVEFGAIKASPEQIEGYLTNGSGSATGVAREDVACFQADATFFYKPGYQGPATEGEAQAWHWFLERDDAGTWVVTDWGY